MSYDSIILVQDMLIMAFLTVSAIALAVMFVMFRKYH